MKGGSVLPQDIKKSKEDMVRYMAEKLENITTNDESFETLAKEAGVENFGSTEDFKYELMDYLMNKYVDELSAIIDTPQYHDLTGINQLEELIKQQYQYIFEHSNRIITIKEMDISMSENGDARKKYFDFFEQFVINALKKGTSDGSMRSNIDIYKVARLITEESYIRINGIMDSVINDRERMYFLPVEQMEFFIKLIKNEVRPSMKPHKNVKEECMSKAYDELTGLPGKELFYDKVAKVLSENEDKNYELVVTDIERFKLINDNYGMQEGDKLLKYIANRIISLTDPEDPLSARIGADKFFTLIEHKDGAVNKIVKETVEDIKNHSPSMNISLKFGIYKITDKSLPLAFMCDRAMLAANSIKGRYNVSCAYYDDSIRKSLIMEQTITNEMEKALAEEQFKVFFQPKYDLLTECIAGAEALVRWDHPDLGFISPGVFIPIFEKNGFITKMDMFVWDKTCQYMAKWKEKFGMCIPISVNVSRRDIYNADITKTFLALLDKYGLQPEELHLEITETAYTEDSEQLIGVIDSLKRNGFTIEMDDFGSGYSSLNMLSEIPIDILKLDMKFVQGKDLANNRNIMNFVMGLAKWMNLLVVAEGVETQDQINVLKALECNYVQGYFYSKPLPAEEFSVQLEAAGKEQMAQILNYGTESEEVCVHEGGSDRILLVVDSVLWNCNLIYEYFKDSYTVAYTGNGTSAWNYILDNHDKLEMIIADLNISGMNGMELIIKVRSDKEFANIPIIATAQFGQGGEEMALTLGATDFVQKPYGRGVMIRRVQNIIVQNNSKRKRSGYYIEDTVDKSKLDPDTGLYNQEKMKSHIFAFINKKSGSRAIFLVIDIDDFKNITDTFGWPVGKLIIKNVVSVLRKSFRKDEIISHSGGDEFCVFLPEGFEDDSLRKRMERLVDDFKLEVDEMKVTCSVGVCKYPDGSGSYEELYEHAKDALSLAKQSGKNQYRIYGEE